MDGAHVPFGHTEVATVSRRRRAAPCVESQTSPVTLSSVGRPRPGSSGGAVEDGDEPSGALRPLLGREASSPVPAHFDADVV